MIIPHHVERKINRMVFSWIQSLFLTLQGSFLAAFFLGCYHLCPKSLIAQIFDSLKLCPVLVEGKSTELGKKGLIGKIPEDLENNDTRAKMEPDCKWWRGLQMDSDKDKFMSLVGFECLGGVCLILENISEHFWIVGIEENTGKDNRQRRHSCLQELWHE